MRGEANQYDTQLPSGGQAEKGAWQGPGRPGKQLILSRRCNASRGTMLEAVRIPEGEGEHAEENMETFDDTNTLCSMYLPCHETQTTSSITPSAM